MRNFRKLIIWKDAIEIVKKVYQIASQLPNEEKYGLKSQISRASVSIPSNIAEGSSRRSEIEYKRFLEIALGSAFELETQLIIIRELSLVKTEDINKLLEDLSTEQRSINKLITVLNENTTNSK